MPYHAVAMLSGGRQKTLPNKTEENMFSDVVMPYVASGVVTAKWGNKTQSYQVLEMRIYFTNEPWDKKASTFSDVVRNKKNVFAKFEDRAKRLLAKNKERVFMITPIQGSKTGDQEQQRILREFDQRFEVVEGVIEKFGGVAIRIDRERPLEDLVTTIKREIRGARFIIADLTDERQSCYFEAGFAEALAKPIIYVASKNSVMNPGTPTKIHFDIHKNIQFFTNHDELRESLIAVIEKNRKLLLEERAAEESGIVS